MAYLAFYRSTNLTSRTLQSTKIVDEPSMTYNQGGSLDLELKLEVDSSNEAFCKSLKENSHFVVFNPEEHKTTPLKVGGIVEDAYINGNIRTVKIIGFKELLDKIVMYSAPKIGVVGTNTVVGNDDNSHALHLLS